VTVSVEIKFNEDKELKRFNIVDLSKSTNKVLDILKEEDLALNQIIAELSKFNFILDSYMAEAIIRLLLRFKKIKEKNNLFSINEEDKEYTSLAEENMYLQEEIYDIEELFPFEGYICSLLNREKFDNILNDKSLTEEEREKSLNAALIQKKKDLLNIASMNS